MGMVYGRIVLLHSFSSWYEEKGFCANLGADTILFKVGQLLAQRPSWIYHNTFSLLKSRHYYNEKLKEKEGPIYSAKRQSADSKKSIQTSFSSLIGKFTSE